MSTSASCGWGVSLKHDRKGLGGNLARGLIGSWARQHVCRDQAAVQTAVEIKDAQTEVRRSEKAVFA